MKPLEENSWKFKSSQNGESELNSKYPQHVCVTHTKTCDNLGVALVPIKPIFFLKDSFYYLYMCINRTPMYIGQKKLLGILELKLQVVVRRLK